MSVPSTLLYFTNSGATTGIDFHFALTSVTARAPPFGGLIQSSGARVAVSPTYANTPLRDRAKSEGLTMRRSTGRTRPSPDTIASSLVNPRATATTSDSLSIHFG